MEEIVKKMLEAWVSRNNILWIDRYNFIRNDGGYYIVSVIETNKEKDTFLSIYKVEINDDSCRIIEMA